MSEELVARDTVERLDQVETSVGGTIGPGLLTLGAVEAAATCSPEALLMEQALPPLAGSSQCPRNLTNRNTGH